MVATLYPDFTITICGAGALGGNICESLARIAFGNLRLIDRDRIEERNLSNQPYHQSDIGALKAKILANDMYRAIGATIEPMIANLIDVNARKLLKGSDLVVDAFDNSESRKIVTDTCQKLKIPCLHAGLADDYAEVIWDEHYTVPTIGGDDACDYPLARNLIMIAVAVTCDVLMDFVTGYEKNSYTITLGDLTIKRF